MAGPRATPSEILVRNVKYLLQEHGWSEAELARRAKLAQRTVNKTMNRESNPSIETAESLASAFGLNGWQLLLRDLPDRFPLLKQLTLLDDHYMDASKEGRALINMVADREAARDPKKTGNGD